jgi:hypothetical protein
MIGLGGLKIIRLSELSKRRESATVAFSGVRIGSGAWSFGYAG